MLGARAEVSSGRKKKVRGPILVVEDEVLVRMIIADELRNAGFTVIEASTAHEALELLRQKSVDVRLIFSDPRMPGTRQQTRDLAHMRGPGPSQYRPRVRRRSGG